MRTKRAACAVPMPAAEILESRQLLSGDVVLSPLPTDGFVIAGHTTQLHLVAYRNPENSATFGDSDVTIDWGDGTAPTTGAVVPDWHPGAAADTPGPRGMIFGDHAYATAGNYSVTVSINVHTDGQPDRAVTATETLKAVAPTITAGKPLTPRAYTGGTAAVNVAQFLVNFFDDTKTFTATIDWGDGTATTSGQVANLWDGSTDTPNESGGAPVSYTRALGVTGEHAYATAGSFTATVTLSDANGLTATNTATIQVSDSPLQFNKESDTLQTVVTPAPPVERLLGSFNDLSRQFDKDRGDTGSYHITIDWGDGTTSEGRVAPQQWVPAIYPPPPPIYFVYGTHSYATPGDYTATMHVTDDAGHSADGTVAIHAAPESISLTPTPVDGTANRPLYGTFALGDSNITSLSRLDGLKATIDWGDGSEPTEGRVDLHLNFAHIVAGMPPEPNYDFGVSGHHTYDAVGDYTIKVTVTTPGGLSQTVEMTTHIGRYVGFVNPVFGVVHVGEAFDNHGGAIATVAVPGADASADGVTATIDWGDGSPAEAATIEAVTVRNPPGSPTMTDPRVILQVKGSHTYQAAGAYLLKVTITDPDGVSQTFADNSVLVVGAGTTAPGGGGGQDCGPPNDGGQSGTTAPVSPPTAGSGGGNSTSDASGSTTSSGTQGGTSPTSGGDQTNATPPVTVAIPVKKTPLTPAQQAKVAKAQKLAQAKQLAALHKAQQAARKALQKAAQAKAKAAHPHGPMG